MSDSKDTLVCANETLVGGELVDAVKRHADGGGSVHVISPQSQPHHGYVIYDEAVRDAAENRLAMTLARFREEDIEVTGSVEDPDPFSAIMDALGDHDYGQIVISTHPATRSGWLREDLVERVRQAARRPVEHVVVDLGANDDTIRVLVVANQTVGGQPLIDQLKAIDAEEGEHRFVVISPQSGQPGADAVASERLAATLSTLEDSGIKAIGQVAEPDPYTSIQNALQFYGIDQIVISTFPETRSGWLRGDLINRVEAATSKPVYHVVAEGTTAEAA